MFQFDHPLGTLNRCQNFFILLFPPFQPLIQILLNFKAQLFSISPHRSLTPLNIFFLNFLPNKLLLYKQIIFYLRKTQEQVFFTIILYFIQEVKHALTFDLFLCSTPYPTQLLMWCWDHRGQGNGCLPKTKKQCYFKKK